jgi:hypothetical protein
MDAVARTFKPLWKTRQSFTVQDLGGNKVAFVFEDAMDLERVLVNEPWTYDKFLVVFQRVQGDGPIQDSLFSHTSFWVQLHNLPLRRRTEAAAEAIGQSIGWVEQVAASDDERGGENCMSSRVRMEVNSPLCRGRLVKFEEGQKGWVAFRYERLPNFCYWCGCLDHGEKDCDLGLQQRNSSTKEEYQFGAWLRATSDRPPRKTVVTVNGNQPKGKEKQTREDRHNHQATPKTAVPNSDESNNGKDPDVTENDLGIDMEIEPNPVFPNSDMVQKSNDEIFNDQLKEIDQAINYIPYGEQITEQVLESPYIQNHSLKCDATPAGPPTKNTGLLSSPKRRPLGDISNGLNTTQDRRPSTTKWKKLARAQKPTSASPTIAQSHKRDLLLVEENPVHGKRHRTGPDQCNFSTTPPIDNTLENMHTKISAAADSQPCRKP